MAAAAAGVPVWGDVELAWRLDRSGRFGPPRRWLVVTGTNGKTTTTSMLHEMLLAGGRASLLCGNIGTPVIDVLALPGDHLAVELSSFQLHWSDSLRPEAGVVLNVAEDHLDWHGSLPAYAADKARALTGQVAVAGVDDPIRVPSEGTQILDLTQSSLVVHDVLHLPSPRPKCRGSERCRARNRFFRHHQADGQRIPSARLSDSKRGKVDRIAFSASMASAFGRSK